MAHVAAVLTRRYGTPVEARRVRDWVRKGLLPPLSQRGRGRGKGKSYFWAQRDITQQASAIFELLHWRGRTDLIPLQLWLLGYDMPLRRVRPTLLSLIERSITVSTQGVDAADTEELENALSGLAYRASALRGGRSSVTRRIPRPVRENVAELVFNTLFNADFRPNLTTLSELIQGLNTANEDQVERPMSTDAGELQGWQRIIRFIQRHFNRTHHRDLVARAPEALFAQAQEDFCLLCDVLESVFARSSGRSYPWPAKYNVVGNLGLVLIPLLLSLREAGYEEWIGWGRALLSHLSRPGIQDALVRGDFESLRDLLDVAESMPSMKSIVAHQTT